MSKKLRKRNTYANQDHKILRSVVVRASTLNAESRSVEVVVATENPIKRYDKKRGTVIDEILRMDGVEFRNARNQLPIVDSHDSSSTENVLGSVRNLRREGDELVGDASFASDPKSQVAFDKLRDGHLTDFSITATPNEVAFIERGETYSIGGADITGPAEIVTRWQPLDASLVATGADERSTVRSSLRRSYENLNPEDDEMNAALKAALVKRGMSENATDEEALVFVETVGVAVMTDPGSAPETPEPAPETPEPETPAESETETEAVDRALKADRSRCREIRALCGTHLIERAQTDKFCNDGTTVDAVRKHILDNEPGKPVGPGASVTRSQIDKTKDALRDGLIKRALVSAGSTSDPFKDKPAAEGHEDFQHMSLSRMAQSSLEAGGIDTRRMTSRDIAAVAMGSKSAIERLNIRRDGEAYHVTGSFANLMQDAANKTLLMGYDEAPYTWSTWWRQAGSVADFKAINRTRFSEAPNLDVVPENTPYPEGAMSDAKESYKVEKYGQIFSVSWETIVNDDLDAISRIPAMHGNAARRKQNQVAYAVLTANAAMADTGALFNATAQTTAGGHANLAGSGAVISVATLNAGFLSMMTKKGLNTSVTINVQPRFLIVPAAIAATALSVTGSLSDPAVGGSAAGNSNVTNLYGPNGSRPLQVVVDPELDGNSATKWYLAASPSQIDTVELAFLAGEETPVLETEWDFDTDTYRYKIRQTFGVAPIDFRGLYSNPGA